MPSKDEAGHRVDTEPPGARIVGLDLGAVAARAEELRRLAGIEPGLAGEGGQRVAVADILAGEEIAIEQPVDQRIGVAGAIGEAD